LFGDRHLITLGGRYGEESEVEDQVRSEEDCEEDQAQGGQEEVDQTAEDAIGILNAKRCVVPAGEVESQQAPGFGQATRRRSSTTEGVGENEVPPSRDVPLRAPAARSAPCSRSAARCYRGAPAHERKRKRAKHPGKHKHA
jgi:hypothetical protein